MRVEGWTSWARRHWFYLLLPVWLSSSLALHRSFDWGTAPRAGEAIALFDWCLFMPALFALCYWHSLTRRALLIRVIALALGGLWIASAITPDEAELMLRGSSSLRIVGLTVLALLEGAVLVAVLRIAYSKEPDMAELERQGLPPLLARLMVAEARFWRWLWAKLRGR